MEVNIGKGITLAIDTAKLPANVMEHVVYIGLRNILMDSHASVTRESDGENFVANAQATAEKKLAAMMAGEVRTTSTREGDPVKAEAIRMASETVKALIKKSGKRMKSDKYPDGVTPTQVREAALRLIEKDATIMERAKTRVAEQKALGGDLADLGL